jgi:hypothetical protein
VSEQPGGGLGSAAIESRLAAIRGALGGGDWREAASRIGECRILLGPLAEDEASPLRLELLQLQAEATYIGYQQGEDCLEEHYRCLSALTESLEAMRRLRPGRFETLWLFGRLDVYERRVAVAYQLGLVAEAANWAERSRSRRLLDLLLNLPLQQEEADAGG